MKNNLIKYIICIGLIFCFDETLIYDLNFMGMKAGETILSIKKDTINTNSIYHLKSTTKTNSFVDRLYKIRDEIDIFFSQTDFSTIQVIKKIDEGGKRKLFKSVIDYDSLKAISNNKTIKIDGKVLDPLSSIYYLRSQEIKISDIFEFITYDNDKLKDVRVIAKNIETISTPNGDYECIVVIPESKNGKLLRNKGSMKVWFSNNISKLPVKIEHITKSGTMTMILKDIR